MSYILEALKKSQQERDLGHVPTLQTSTFTVDEDGARPNLWILLAVILAALAVVIALYSALRTGSPLAERAETVASGAEMAQSAVAVQDPTASSRPPEDPTSARPTNAAASPRRSTGEPPLHAASADPEVPESAVVIEKPATSAEPKRSARESKVSAQPPKPAADERSSKVPPELIADIEAFKREVRDQSGATGSKKADDKIAPQDLRLPKDVRARLPELVMSAHIYDTDPSKRFVLINGLKTREGEESREKITVEQILPDGAVLSFKGHRFFEKR